MKKITGLDIYRFVSVLALVVVVLVLVLDSIYDIGVHSFPQLLVVISLNVIISFAVIKKKNN